MPPTGNGLTLFLGAGAGLGQAVMSQLNEPCLNLSRRSEPAFDFAKEDGWPDLVAEIRRINPRRIWYFTGGGPYGNFQKKAWKDHQWAMRVTFLCPAFLLHSLLGGAASQIIFVGSSVAEGRPDPHAASYCASKHALKGLIETVQEEIRQLSLKQDVRLFSPGYMETAMLPPGALPRQDGRAKDPNVVAKEFLTWALRHDSMLCNWVSPQL